MSTSNLNRRGFLKRACGAAVAGSALSGIVIAEEAAKLPEDDPMAMALGYKHDAESVDVEKFPRRVSNPEIKQTCANCTLFMNNGDVEAEWAPCSIFQNKLVAKGGWCNTWILKPGV